MDLMHDISRLAKEEEAAMVDQYYTFYDYMKEANITASEEDYLEMIYRLSPQLNQDIRVNEIAQALNIKAPSVSHMVRKLNQKELLIFERYGRVKLTSKGRDIAQFLFRRHETIYRFLTIIGVEGDRLKETEKIEHMLSQETVDCLQNLAQFFEENPQFFEQYQTFKKRQ